MSAIPPLRVGLAGAGFLAETRARCWRRVHTVPIQLQVVATRTPERARSFAARHGVGALCTSFDELLQRDDVDVVDLCVPNHLHRPFAVAAAQAGKHVVCTKPLAAYVGQDLGPEPEERAVLDRAPEVMLQVATSDAEAMVAAARAAGVQLLYGENWIFAPAVRRALALARASGGVLLELRGWEAHSGSHSPFSRQWRHAGGGALLRLGAHPIGAMLHLKREEGLARDGQPIPVVAVTAEVADLTARTALTAANTRVATGWGGVENWGCAVLQFADGSRGVAHGSDAALGGMQSRLLLAGSNFQLDCSLSPNDALRAFGAEPETFPGEYLQEKLETQAGWSTPMPDEDWSSGHQGMLQSFAETIALGAPAPSDGELGLAVTRVVYAAYRSAREGRRIELS